MAGGDPWARVVWLVYRSEDVLSAWTTEAAAEGEAREIMACVSAPIPLDPPPSGDVIRPEIEFWRSGGRGRRPGLAAPGDDAA